MPLKTRQDVTPYHIDSRLRLWQVRGTAYQQHHGSVTVWACFSNDCKHAMQVLDRTLTSMKYLDHLLQGYFIPHFDESDIHR